MPIGVFDSGVGGITVLRALHKRLPRERFLYLGDTARLPYGSKSEESVRRYALQTAHMLVNLGVKMLVIACNTASSAAIETLRAEFPGIPVVGVIEPGARAACEGSRTGCIAVIGTEGTVRGGAYTRAIKAIRPEANVVSSPAPLFVGLAEEGWTDGDVVEAIAAKYLAPVLDCSNSRADCLVLGCTHFPVLSGAISSVTGPDVRIVDSAETTAREVETQLAAHGLAATEDGGGETRYLATDDASRFARVARVFLGSPLDERDVTIVDL